MADCKKYNDSTWEHSLRKLTTATDTITTLPVDIYADGNTATIGISGNTTQSGTPTPDNPIMPEGTGERTGNLFDEDYTSISTNAIYKAINVGDGDFTLSSNAPLYNDIMAVLFLLAGNVSSGISTPINGASVNQSRTVTAIDGYVTIAYRTQGTINPDNYNTMLNLGSTALPYEPYGYKIPISSANTTTPVYLGEVQTERQIKKLVLTGEEDWVYITGGKHWVTVTGYQKSGLMCVSSHYVAVTNGSGSNMVVNGQFGFYSSSNDRLIFCDTNYTTTEDWKSYLAAQYANGTPVTVWYVLAEPETAVINEPIRKIGDYADTVSGITIPTITGKDTFDVQTTLKPSEVSLAYTGWHDATVKEWDGSEWQQTE